MEPQRSTKEHMSEIDDEDDEYEEVDRSPVTPNCCEEVKQQQLVVLVCPNTWYSGDVTTPPAWHALGVTRSEYKIYMPVNFCPCCGKKLPNVVPVTPPRPVSTCIDGCSMGGDYCNTCKERLRCCRCLPPERAWGPENGTAEERK